MYLCKKNNNGGYTMNSEGGVYLPKGSICENCIYCICRVVEPLNYEVFDMGEDAKDSIVVQVSCLLLDIDLHDHVTRECSKHESATNSLLMGDKFLG